MNYNINPIRAIKLKYKNSEFPTEDLNSVNTDCYDICSAFSGTINPYEADSECTAKCKSLIDKKRRELYGVGACDHQQPYLPLIWNQTPNYFPGLMKATMDPERSLRDCQQLCNNVAPTFKAGCLDKCQLQYDSIEKCDVPSQSVSTKRDNPSSFATSEPDKETQKWTTSEIIGLVLICIFALLGFLALVI